MAEINVKRKKSSVWPWIIAVLIVVAIIAVLALVFDNEEYNQEDEMLENENEMGTELIQPIQKDNLYLVDEFKYA